MWGMALRMPVPQEKHLQLGHFVRIITGPEVIAAMQAPYQEDDGKDHPPHHDVVVEMRRINGSEGKGKST